MVTTRAVRHAYLDTQRHTCNCGVPRNRLLSLVFQDQLPVDTDGGRRGWGTETQEVPRKYIRCMETCLIRRRQLLIESAAGGNRGCRGYNRR